ncbi:MAG: alpha/beta hydrolase, partial [Proteobacteria bacterium]|nr:alpha/beta hydrolase [Pseudomonadota bacterium]
MDPLHRNNVRVVGRTDSPRTIVFVHGFGTSQEAWRDVAAPFLADWRIVLLDNVGAGASPPEAFVQHRYLGLATYANDLVEVVRSLDLCGAVFVGHSVGAMIALLAAVQEPPRCSRLVLLGASPRYLDEPGYRGGFSSPDLAQIYRAVAENYADWTDAFAPAMMDN